MAVLRETHPFLPGNLFQLLYQLEIQVEHVQLETGKVAAIVVDREIVQHPQVDQ